eukprot:4402990-Amphidinium_carterae.2
MELHGYHNQMKRHTREPTRTWTTHHTPLRQQPGTAEQSWPKQPPGQPTSITQPKQRAPLSVQPQSTRSCAFAGNGRSQH